MILKIFIKLAQQRTCHDELGVDDHKTGIFKKTTKNPGMPVLPNPSLHYSKRHKKRMHVPPS